ncbi:MAG: hypothetical protein K2Y39_07930 [Candidatus Obscuribacterales bacterium]|nr:hypothetical protein [Candidatus Obscuribacterales bacterium]
MHFFRNYVLPFVIFVGFVLLGLISFAPQTPLSTKFCAGVFFVIVYTVIQICCFMIGFIFRSALLVIVAIFASAAASFYIVSLLPFDLSMPDALWKLFLMSAVFSLIEFALADLTKRR